MKKYFVFLGAVILFMACQRDLDNPADPEKQCRITRMVQGLNNGTETDSVYTFFYDAAGRLERIHENMYQFDIDYMLQYDAQGRLVRLDNNFGFGYYISDFSYNTQGRLKEIRGRLIPDSVKIAFEYTTDTLPVASKEYVYNAGQWELEGENKYTFLGGNLVKRQYTRISNPGGEYEEEYGYYDTIPNKLGNLALVSFYSVTLGYYDACYLFSKKMLKSRTSDNTNGLYVNYKLDSGRILSSVESFIDQFSSDTFHRASRSYEYDCK